MDALCTCDVLGCEVYCLVCGCFVFGVLAVVYVHLN